MRNQIETREVWKKQQKTSNQLKNLLKKYKKILPEEEFYFYKQFEKKPHKRNGSYAAGAEEREVDQPNYKNFISCLIDNLRANGVSKKKSIFVATKLTIKFGLSDTYCKIWQLSNKSYKSISPDSQKVLQQSYLSSNFKNSRSIRNCGELDEEKVDCLCEDSFYCKRQFEKIKKFHSRSKFTPLFPPP